MSCNSNPNFGCSANPCTVTQTNTAACESLPSQIQNFSDQFFGEVIKTEVDGEVVWSLPCSLETGLPNNPRAAGEGLACYFLRLFDEGIVGLTGPAGATGSTGADGRNAYTVTLQSFVQPASGGVVQVLTAYNPAILVGMRVFIDTSGWYQVNLTDTSGMLFLTLIRAADAAPATISAGKVVVPAGFEGAAIVGPQGPSGPQGDPGETTTNTNGFYFVVVGTDYRLQTVYGQVSFTTSVPAFILNTPGKYLLSAVIDLVGLAGVGTGDKASFKIRNLTSLTDVPGSEHVVSRLSQDERKQVVINSIYTTLAANQQITLFGVCDSPDVISAVALNTTFSFIRLE